MHHRAKDITGLRVGYLTAIRYHGSDGKKSLWEVKCDCGKTIIRDPSQLKKLKARGVEASCGCQKKATISRRLTKHGMSGHPAYWVWRSMVDRCRLPSHQAWANYGGRGIEVCDHWRERFENFWADMGPTYAKGLTLEREKNDLGYSKSNCVWATYKAQASNKRETITLDTPKGRMAAASAADAYGIKRTTLYWRLNAGWSVMRALGLSTT